MSNSKVKGLLKGLRYISQIFDSAKEAEMQIGNPTDVKHVAHIGWEGPSVNSPSWMNEFKKKPSISSAPLCLPATGDSCMSEDASGGGDSNSTGQSPPVGPKSSRPPSSIESSTARERSDRPKARRSSKSKTSDQTQITSTDQNDSPAALCLRPDIPRTGRRKKTIKSKAHVADSYKSPFSDPGLVSATGSISMSNGSSLCLTP